MTRKMMLTNTPIGVDDSIPIQRLDVFNVRNHVEIANINFDSLGPPWLAANHVLPLNWWCV